MRGLCSATSDHEIEVIGLYNGWRSLFILCPTHCFWTEPECVAGDRDGATNLVNAH